MKADVPPLHVADLFIRSATRYEDMPAFATRKKQLEWEPVSFSELYNKGLALATGLIELGVEAREHVGIFGDNRFEWILSDYGIQFCGAASVPRGRDVTDDDLVYIINHANIRVAFVETETLQQKIKSLRPRMEGLRDVIIIDPQVRPGEGERTLTGVLSLGKQLLENGDRRAKERIDNIRPDDLFTLIYTSGTTGKPKGVMLTHANIVSQLQVMPITLTCTDRVLSILPIWHIFERAFEIFSIYNGSCTYYTSVRTLSEDIRNVEPTFMGSAPRLWEGMHKRIMEGIKAAHPVRRALFHIAYFLGYHYQESLFYMRGHHLKLKYEPTWKNLSLRLANFLRFILVMPWYGFFNATVLENIRLATGGALKATISGGGALPLEIDRFFNYIGIPVLEGYGLTETSPVLAARTEKNLVLGTIGPVVPKTEIRIIDLDTNRVLYPNKDLPNDGRGLRGEICVRGPQVMKGYYREPELTEKAFLYGWFRTGDIGMMTFNNCLKILGRSKSTIVLSNGENLEPEPIELRLGESPYIDHCMVVGQDQKHVGLLIVPNLDGFREAGVQAETIEELTRNPEARRIMDEDIKKKISSSAGFRGFELIREYRFVPDRFKVGDELTDLHKMKRHVIASKYENLIHEIYSNGTTSVK